MRIELLSRRLYPNSVQIVDQSKQYKCSWYKQLKLQYSLSFCNMRVGEYKAGRQMSLNVLRLKTKFDCCNDNYNPMILLYAFQSANHRFLAV